MIFFNLRADRARQLTRAFTGLNFDSFERERIQNLHFATFTPIRPFDQHVDNISAGRPGAPARGAVRRTRRHQPARRRDRKNTRT